MKRIFHLFAISGSLLVTLPAHAQGMPVFDGANLSQAINQVTAWKKQYEQMNRQYTQLQQQHLASTGVRGLGAIVNNPALGAIVPYEAAQQFNAIASLGSSSLTSPAQAIRNATRLYDCQDRTGSDRTSCQAFLNVTAQAQAYQQKSMALLQQRMIQIQQLQSRINTTADPKSIAELQARLQVESIQVNNDANRLMVLQAMSNSADRATQQALKERELQNLSLTSDGSDTFVSKPYQIPPLNPPTRHRHSSQPPCRGKQALKTTAPSRSAGHGWWRPQHRY
jgi:type IV secretion system protein VirB5